MTADVAEITSPVEWLLLTGVRDEAVVVLRELHRARVTGLAEKTAVSDGTARRCAGTKELQIQTVLQNTAFTANNATTTASSDVTATEQRGCKTLQVPKRLQDAAFTGGNQSDYWLGQLEGVVLSLVASIDVVLQDDGGTANHG